LLTKPHFYDTDESVLDNVIGLEPEAAKHDSRLDVYPVSDTEKVLIRF